MTVPAEIVLIRTADGAEDYDAFASVVTRYVEWVRNRYREHPSFIDEVFGHQSLVDELADLSHAYGPPRGKTLLAIYGGELAGAGAYRRLDGDVCEMKRLFVLDRFKGHGIGRKICEALIATARADGFTLMRLDTGRLLLEAIRMYRSVGFQECAPYHQYPDDLMPFLFFMELSLRTAG